MDYWEKADYSWSDDSKRHILTPSSKSRTLFYYIQEIKWYWGITLSLSYIQLTER